MVDFKNNKSLKDHLVRATLLTINTAASSKPCWGKRPIFQLCKHFKTTTLFGKHNSIETYKVKQSFNFNSKNVVYLIECRVCQKPYIGSTTTKFRQRANNYKSIFRKFESKKDIPKQALNQRKFHTHYCSDDHSGIDDWLITIIDSDQDEKCLRRKELYWIHKLETFEPNGLNEREVYSAY